jgi:hypothetical protein
MKMTENSRSSRHSERQHRRARAWALLTDQVPVGSRARTVTHQAV